METDPEKIKKLAKEKEDENWRFRSFLKMIDKSPEEVDAVVQRLYQEISSKIDCATCRNCCKELIPALEEEDIKRLSRAMELTVDQFRDQYVLKDELGDYTFRERPCPLFKDNKCMYFDDRPRLCKSFPHFITDGFVFRLMGVIRYCSVCPIVYNVYERLKGELWHYDFEDDYEDFEDDYEDFEDDYDDFEDPDDPDDIDSIGVTDILGMLKDIYFRGYDENA